MSNNRLPTALSALVSVPMAALLAGMAPERPRVAVPPASAPARSTEATVFDISAFGSLQGSAAAALSKGDFATVARLAADGAERGDRLAMSVLGLLHAEARGVPQDRIAAERLWLAAAEAGDPSAARNLAKLYARGVLGTPDPERSRQWSARAESIAR